MNDKLRGGPASAVYWSTLRSKLLPIAVVRLPGWSWRPRLFLRNWYYGAWWEVEFGAWLILGGRADLTE